MARDIPRGPVLTRAQVSSIRHPVLGIYGSDSYVPEAPKVLPQLLPDCRVEIVPGQDHSVLVKAPRVVRNLLLRWIAGHDLAAVMPAARGSV
jgi:pimeloyl-ACP methyl ester carboxylesterase